jgi:hypothetical protein
MTDPGQSPSAADSPVTSADSGKNEVPSGNLFMKPKLTALDPADKKERKDVERLLESLEGAEAVD